MQGIQRLHRDLFIYSTLIIISSIVSISSRQISWLIAVAVPSFTFWVFFYCKEASYSFPGSIPNVITCSRCFLLVLVTVLHTNFSNMALGIMFALVCMLDMLDGYLARKLRQSSLLGEYLDKETDALFVLILSILIYIRIIPSFWVLIPGLIRYLYFISIFVFLKENEKEHKDPWARIIAVFMFISIIAVYILPLPIGTILYAVATVAILYSFGRSALIQAGLIKIKSI